MTSRTKHSLTFSIRWGIAVAGIVWVLLQIKFHDLVTVIDPATGRPESAQVLDDAREDQPVYRILRHNKDGSTREETVSRDELWSSPDRKFVDIQKPDGSTEHRKLLAVRRAGGRIADVLVEDPNTKKGVIVNAANVVDARQIGA